MRLIVDARLDELAVRVRGVTALQEEYAKIKCGKSKSLFPVTVIRVMLVRYVRIPDIGPVCYPTILCYNPQIETSLALQKAH